MTESSQPPPPQPPPPYPYVPYPPPFNTYAILSLVFALFVFAPLGIYFGKVAKRQIAQTGERGIELAGAPPVGPCLPAGALRLRDEGIIPPAIDPGEPSSPPPGPPNVRASRHGPTIGAAPASACSPVGGSTADGMMSRARGVKKSLTRKRQAAHT